MYVYIFRKSQDRNFSQKKKKKYTVIPKIKEVFWSFLNSSDEKKKSHLRNSWPKKLFIPKFLFYNYHFKTSQWTILFQTVSITSET